MLAAIRRIAGLAVLSCHLGPASQVVAPPAAASLDLDGLFVPAAQTTLAFVSDEVIVVGRHPGPNGSFSAVIAAVRWRDGKLQLLTTAAFPLERPVFGRGLFPAAHGSVIAQFRPTALLLSEDLKIRAKLPVKVLIPPVPQGAVVAAYEGFKSWKLYRLVPDLAFVRNGAGEVLSVSDDFVVYRGAQDVRVETVQGDAVGQFQVPPRSVCEAMIIGPRRLYVDGCGPSRIVDFHGKELLKVPSPDGWGFRFGLSLDGSRMLFDYYTRRITVLQRMYEAFESLISLGMGPIITSIGEIIRVVDTTSGKVCLDVDSPDQGFGMAGEYHADISPSGRFLALVTANRLSVYRIPSECGTSGY